MKGLSKRKAPGIDMMLSKFFQTCLKKGGKDVITLIKEVFN